MSFGFDIWLCCTPGVCNLLYKRARSQQLVETAGHYPPEQTLCKPMPGKFAIEKKITWGRQFPLLSISDEKKSCHPSQDDKFHIFIALFNRCRSLSGWPVALSLTASFMSAITVLGTPAEVYTYGTMFWWFFLSYTLVAITTANVYVPVFYKLGVSTTYEVRIMYTSLL